MAKFKNEGEDVFIHAGAQIKRPDLVSLGNHVAIDNGVVVSTQLEVGNYVHISPHVCFIGGATAKVTLGHFVFIAAGTKIVAGTENYTGTGLVGATIPAKYRDLIFDEVVVGDFAGCGVNCSILQGVKMGEGSILGANSLLLEDTEPWGIYVGSPAKLIKYRQRDIILKHAKELGYVGS